MSANFGNALFAIGVSYIIALSVGRFTSRIHAPKVTGYLVVGLVAGPSFAELIGLPTLISWKSLDSMVVLSDMALALILMLIGSQFRIESLKRWGKRLIILSGWEIFVTFVSVAIVIFFVNYAILQSILGASFGLTKSSLYIAIFAGVISISGAPAASLLVVREYESDGPVTDLVLTLIGLNNLISIIFFNLFSYFMLHSHGSFGIFIFKLVSPILVGSFTGLLLSVWAQRLENMLEIQLLFIGAIIGSIGVYQLWGVDLFLTCFVAGLVITNASPKAADLFKAISGIDYPLYVIFFIIAGASLHLDALTHLGILGVAYIVLRTWGKIIGNWIGAKIAGFGNVERQWLGYAMLAQAGVAIGLAQTLVKIWPEGGLLIQTLILGSVVVFELFGPIAFRTALVEAGEVPVLTLFRKQNPQSAIEGMQNVIKHFSQSLGLPKDHDVVSAGDILVEHIMRRNVETIREDMAFNEILRFISHSRYDHFPITDKDNNYIGVIDYSDIRDVIVDKVLSQIVVARDLVKPEPLTLHPKQKLSEVLEIFQQFTNVTYLPVVEQKQKGRLVGIVSQNDVLATFQTSGQQKKQQTPVEG